MSDRIQRMTRNVKGRGAQVERAPLVDSVSLKNRERWLETIRSTRVHVGVNEQRS